MQHEPNLEPHLESRLAQPASAAADQLCPDDVGSDTQYFCHILRDMVAIGAELNHLVLQEAKAHGEAASAGPGPSPVQQATVAYECVTRAMRRNMMLHEKLLQTRQKPSSSQRTAARKKIIRDVEDIIQCKAPAEEQETLHAELLERLDRPELDDEIADRPVGDIVTDISRDLGLAGLHGSHLWKRRIPHDIAILNARAEQFSGAAPSEKLRALLAAAPPPPPPRRITPILPLDLSKIPDDELDILIKHLGES
jgi:hypothetical protein